MRKTFVGLSGLFVALGIIAAFLPLKPDARAQAAQSDSALAVLPPGLPPSPTKAQGTSTAECEFVLGFATIKSLIPSTVGDCLENVWYNPENGDALQQTTGGLLVWRKADNFTAFTDGWQSWVNGLYGLKRRLNDERYPWEGGARGYLRPAGCLNSVEASVAYPVRGGGTQTLYARGIDPYGQGIPGADGRITVYYSTVTRAFGLAPTNGVGRTAVTWNIGGPRGWVRITASLSKDGCTAAGETGFQGR